MVCRFLLWGLIRHQFYIVSSQTVPYSFGTTSPTTTAQASILLWFCSIRQGISCFAIRIYDGPFRRLLTGSVDSSGSAPSSAIAPTPLAGIITSPMQIYGSSSFPGSLQGFRNSRQLRESERYFGDCFPVFPAARLCFFLRGALRFDPHRNLPHPLHAFSGKFFLYSPPSCVVPTNVSLTFAHFSFAFLSNSSFRCAFGSSRFTAVQCQLRQAVT